MSFQFCSKMPFKQYLSRFIENFKGIEYSHVQRERRLFESNCVKIDAIWRPKYEQQRTHLYDWLVMRSK